MPRARAQTARVFQPAPSGLGVAGLAITIAGAALFGASAASHTGYNDEVTALREARGSCGAAGPVAFDAGCADIDDIRQENNALVIAGGVATGLGLALVGSAILWAAVAEDDEGVALSVAPWVTVDHRGLVVADRY